MSKTNGQTSSLIWIKSVFCSHSSLPLFKTRPKLPEKCEIAPLHWKKKKTQNANKKRNGLVKKKKRFTKQKILKFNRQNFIYIHRLQNENIALVYKSRGETARDSRHRTGLWPMGFERIKSKVRLVCKLNSIR